MSGSGRATGIGLTTTRNSQPPDRWARNPRGPDTPYDPSEPTEKKRVHRGGSFLCTDQYCSRYMVDNFDCIVRGHGRLEASGRVSAREAARGMHCPEAAWSDSCDRLACRPVFCSTARCSVSFQRPHGDSCPCYLRPCPACPSRRSRMAPARTSAGAETTRPVGRTKPIHSRCATI
jgi:hypothetical protein